MSSTHGKNAVYIKKQNETAFKTLLYRKGPLSRSEIAAELSLSSPTITNIVGEYIHQGLMTELPETEEGTPHGVGRKPIKVDFVAGARLSLGISLGRDLTHWCVCDLRGGIVSKGILSAMPDDYRQMLGQLCSLVDGIRRDQPDVWSRLVGICLVMPGYVDAQRGRPKSRGGREKMDWNGRPLAEDLAAFAKLPVCCENNVRARAYSLQLFRPELLEGASSYAFCYLNWGIACPVSLLNLTSEDISFEGEIGHMIMDPNGISLNAHATPKKQGESPWQTIMRSYEGAPGSLETYSSVYAMLEYCSSAMERGETPILSNICPDSHSLTPDVLWRAQELGDPVVCSTIDRAMTYIGIALANIVNFVNPHRIFLSGQAFRNPQNVRTVKESFEQYVFHSGDEMVTFCEVYAGEYGSAMGACAVALRRFFILGG